MKKHRNLWLTLGIVFILCIGGYIFFFAIPKHTATNAVNAYMQEQGLSDDQVRSEKIQKDWKSGGYVATVKLKDDPEMTYEYNYDKKFSYPHHIYLLVFKQGSGQNDKDVKYPPLK
ncbi:DUF3139 domain-containing protein [Listeria weihenstephanensis]|uniref:DUF3139 domain-containing protein n=1 Tax=Listeria weihenstephanensis TaxID=1006155 RepID=A0A841Z456_9LIST|nr:DUF3139 domain-containing protein [Listeria weihenstephanensis]MBC1499699.1 DUF3139 domain-containing protein [Listeria weihenstephanensis]